MSGSTHYAILQYSGAHFAGWQAQRDVRTVQGELERALTRLAGGRVVTHAAGRTDAGVHAIGQVVHFTLPTTWADDRLQRALNALVPSDLWIARVGSAPDGFHARKSARARRYRFVIGLDPGATSPFRAPFEWAVGHRLDGGQLRAAAAMFLGRHDFRAFSAVGQPKPHYHCSVTTSEWRERPNGEGFIFTIEADRFLHKMVRFLVGVMVDVGSDRRPLEDIPRLEAAAENRESSPPAPPHGLYFVCARYPQLETGFPDEIFPRHGEPR